VVSEKKRFKMVATAGLSLTLDPMGKMFQNASSLKPLGQLKQTAQEYSCEGPLKSLGFLYQSEIQDG
jgi:hypothetical protein